MTATSEAIAQREAVIPPESQHQQVIQHSQPASDSVVSQSENNLDPFHPCMDESLGVIVD